MAKIDLDKIYETYIQIPKSCGWSEYINILRKKVSPMISGLKEEGVIKWFSFQIVSPDRGGVPRENGDEHCYIHIWLELTKDDKLDRLKALIELYCHYFPKIKGNGKKRKVRRSRLELRKSFDSSLLKGCQIEEAWNLMGEGSAWILKMLDAHSSDKEVPCEHVCQFLHYITNALSINELLIPGSPPPKQIVIKQP